MSRYWAGLPVVVMVGVPIWTDSSDVVIAIIGVAAIVSLLGLVARLLALVTAGALIGTIGYALATTVSAEGADVVAAAAFGLAVTGARIRASGQAALANEF